MQPFNFYQNTTKILQILWFYDVLFYIIFRIYFCKITESNEYKSAQEELDAAKEKRAECQKYIEQLQNEMVQFKQMSEETSNIAEDIIKQYDENIESGLKNMDEKALKKYRQKLVKLSKNDKLHSEIYNETIALVDYYLTLTNGN